MVALSRTLWGSLIIMLLYIYGYLTMKNLKKGMIVLFLFGLLLLIAFTVPKSQQAGPQKTFLGKIAHSFKEIMISEYKNKKDIAENWRGFESFKALQTYVREGGGIRYLIGGGFGKKVDIGFEMQLGREKMRYLPTLHNGYLYALVKTGLVGLFLYFVFFWRIIRYGRQDSSEDPHVRFAGKMIVALSLVFLAVTVVTAGFFNKTTYMPAVVLLGSFIAYASGMSARDATGDQLRRIHDE